jgi:hypothetical protein
LFFPDQIVGFLVGSPLQTGGGGVGGFLILQVFYKLLVSKMSDEGAFLEDPKGKLELISRGEKQRRELEAKGHRFSRASGSTNDGNNPSEECKAAVFQALYKWFKETPFTNLNKKNLALEEVVGKEAFLSRMQRPFEDAISGDKWDEEKQKSGYSKWMRISL